MDKGYTYENSLFLTIACETTISQSQKLNLKKGLYRSLPNQFILSLNDYGINLEKKKKKQTSAPGCPVEESQKGTRRERQEDPLEVLQSRLRGKDILDWG